MQALHSLVSCAVPEFAALYEEGLERSLAAAGSTPLAPQLLPLSAPPACLPRPAPPHRGSPRLPRSRSGVCVGFGGAPSEFGHRTLTHTNAA